MSTSLRAILLLGQDFVFISMSLKENVSENLLDNVRELQQHRVLKTDIFQTVLISDHRDLSSLDIDTVANAGLLIRRSD